MLHGSMQTMYYYGENGELLKSPPAYHKTHLEVHKQEFVRLRKETTQLVCEEKKKYFLQSVLMIVPSSRSSPMLTIYWMINRK